MMLTGDTLKKILEIVAETSGYFVFRDDAGEEYVIARKRDFGSGGVAPASERQLSLPNTSTLAKAVRETAERTETTPSFVLDSINREVARYYEDQREQMVDDLGLDAVTDGGQGGSKPKKAHGKKVRFEPITGDLPPELQE